MTDFFLSLFFLLSYLLCYFFAELLFDKKIRPLQKLFELFIFTGAVEIFSGAVEIFSVGLRNLGGLRNFQERLRNFRGLRNIHGD